MGSPLNVGLNRLTSPPAGRPRSNWTRITSDLKNAVQELEKLDYNLPRVIREVAKRNGDPSIKNHELSHLKNLELRGAGAFFRRLQSGAL
ncbi:MAG: hypothetical protein LAO31_22895 [Acidobacteriia bacterium]|nr:hypothetical protein [Terriglobia bacterium]